MKNFGINLIGMPKYQAGSGEKGIQIQYNGPLAWEIIEQMKKEYPDDYNRLLIEVAREQNPNSEIVMYTDADGNWKRATNIGAGFLSATDPIAVEVVAGAALGKPLAWAGKAILRGLSRAGKMLVKGVDNVINTFDEAAALRNINKVKDNPSLIIDNYYKRTGSMPAELVDDATILRDGMNVKLLYVDELIKIILKNNPGMSYELARIQLDKNLAKEGISIRDIEDAEGLNVSFDLPENKLFDGVYTAKINSPYRRNMTRVHEDGHLTRNHTTKSSKETKGYNADGFRQPQNEYEKYIHDLEKSTYGTEILSILGKDKYSLTGEELKYLYDNADRLGLPREVTRMLNMITDFNQAAKWINNHSNIVIGAGITGIPAITGLNNEQFWN